MQYVWDPPPTNHDDSPIWCLGQRYESHPTVTLPTSSHSNSTTSHFDSKHDVLSASNSTTSHVDSKHDTLSHDKSDSSPDQSGVTASTTYPDHDTFEKIEPQDEGRDNGWPAAFLDDVESKIWLTYRQDFSPIATTSDSKSHGAMSFSTRLKMLANKGTFTSDTGWGCMIRSGQSLLANALAMLELGRGNSHFLLISHLHIALLTAAFQIGELVNPPKQKPLSSPSSPTIQPPHIRSTASSTMAPRPAVQTQANGLAPPPPLAASKPSQPPPHCHPLLFASTSVPTTQTSIKIHSSRRQNHQMAHSTRPSSSSAPVSASTVSHPPTGPR